MRYKCEIPTVNFEDLVKVKCFINSFCQLHVDITHFQHAELKYVLLKVVLPVSF